MRGGIICFKLAEMFSKKVVYSLEVNNDDKSGAKSQIKGSGKHVHTHRHTGKKFQTAADLKKITLINEVIINGSSIEVN